jgi:hypothetical protein
MKTTFGIAMMAAPFVGLAGYCALTVGVSQTVIIFATVLLLAGWFAIASHLLVD